MPEPKGDRYKPTKDVIAKPIGDETIIMDLASGTYFGLSAVGVTVWEGIERGETFAVICSAVNERYDVEPDVAGADVRALIETLLEKGLVEAG